MTNFYSFAKLLILMTIIVIGVSTMVWAQTTTVTWTGTFPCQPPPPQCVKNNNTLQAKQLQYNTTYTYNGSYCNWIDYYPSNDSRITTIEGRAPTNVSITYDIVGARYDIDPSRGGYYVGYFTATINTGPCAGDTFIETDYQPLKQIAKCSRGCGLASINGYAVITYNGPTCSGVCKGPFKYTMNPPIDGSGPVQNTCPSIITN